MTTTRVIGLPITQDFKEDIEGTIHIGTDTSLLIVSEEAQTTVNTTDQQSQDSSGLTISNDDLLELGQLLVSLHYHRAGYL